MKEALLDYFPYEKTEELKNINLLNYQQKQLYKWLYKGCHFDEMSDLSKKNRLLLSEKYIDQPTKIIERYTGKDKTEKYLYQLNDGNIIEGVKMSYKYGNALCVSTQVGCRMGCKFCASTLNGLIRDLTPGEILGQVIAVNHLCGGGLNEERNITNIVLMGSGEPLDNYDNTLKFIKMVNDEEGLNIAMRNISLSTCGLVPEMYKLANEGIQINLIISLHNAFDEKRKLIMPIANKYTISQIIEAAKYYFNKTGRRVIIEYTLIENINDSDDDIKQLSSILKGFPVHINVIRLNPVKERNLKSVDTANAYKFVEKLNKANISATLRRQMGVDIEGACGQLRQKYIENNE